MIIVNFFRAIDRAFEWVIEVLLVFILLAMVGVTFLQVILRNFFNTGIPWAEVAGRHAVLWIAFLGAMIATRCRQHLNIDAVTRLIPRRARSALRVLLDAFSAVICFLLAKAALTFVIEEYAMSEVLFLNLKGWMIQSIIPFGFLMMSIEYCVGVVLDVLRIFDSRVPKRYSDRGVIDTGNPPRPEGEI